MVGDSPPVPMGFRETITPCLFSGASANIVGQTDAFTNVSAGDPLYICDVGDGAAIVGMYRVETKTDDEHLTLDRNGASAEAMNITVAANPRNGLLETGSGGLEYGPFPSIKYALDGQLSAGDILWVKSGDGWILDNIDQQASTITVSSCGVVANNTRVSIKGYYETKGDMCPGGTYHGTPMDALLDSLSLPMLNPNAKWVDIDGDGIAAHLISTADDNIFWHNFSIHGTTGNYNAIMTTAAVVGGGAVNCVFDDVFGAVYYHTSSRGVLFRNCAVGLNTVLRSSGSSIAMRGSGCLVLNNIGKEANGRRHLGLEYVGEDETYGGAVIGNLFIGGTSSRSQTVGSVWANNTFWDCERTSDPTETGAINIVAGTSGQDAISFIFNNVMSPKHITGYGVKIDSGKGSVSVNDNNLIYSQTAGAVLTNKYGSGGNTIPDGTGIIEVDPQLATNSYEPRNRNVLNGGHSGIAGLASGMGVRLPEFIGGSFARRTRYQSGLLKYKW